MEEGRKRVWKEAGMDGDRQEWERGREWIVRNNLN
jgi:hypothetical protein